MRGSKGSDSRENTRIKTFDRFNRFNFSGFARTLAAPARRTPQYKQPF
jgi:hypothetical protein